MHDSKEADRVVHLMLEDGSRLVAFAAGLKKSSSRKAHAIDLLNQVQLKLVEGKSGMPLITEAKLLNGNDKLKNALPGLMFIQACCELMDLFTQEEFPESGYYLNLQNLLSMPDEKQLPLLLAALQLRALYLSGDLPKLNEDNLTGAQIEPGEKRYLNSTIGYSKQGEDAVSDRVFKTQRFILQRDFATIQAVSLDLQEQLRILSIHTNWLRILLDKKLPATQMFYTNYLKK